MQEVSLTLDQYNNIVLLLEQLISIVEELKTSLIHVIFGCSLGTCFCLGFNAWEGSAK